MEKDKKNILTSKIIYIAVVLLSLTLCVLFIQAYKSGISMSNKNNSIKEYNSIEKLLKSTSLDIELPKFIENETGLVIEDTMGKIIKIYNENFVIKIASFVDNMADPLGLYEISEIDNKYSIENENTNIKFFRYRVGYKEYKNSTIINWCTDTTAYGLMLGKKLNEDEALEIIGIERDILSDYNENSVTTSDIPNLTNELKDTTGQYTIYIN